MEKNSRSIESARMIYLIGLVGLQLILAYEWLVASYEKIVSPKFVVDFKTTLVYFASKNPLLWYKKFLLGFATNHASLFAHAVAWSELAVGLVLVGSGVAFLIVENNRLKRGMLLGATVALVGGAIMNVNFYLAAGWTGPGTSGLNVIMFWAQLILLYAWLMSFLQPAS